jgi:hypothetical protein
MCFRSSANFVGSVVGFLNVLVIRLRSLLLAASLSVEIEMALNDFQANFIVNPLPESG